MKFADLVHHIQALTPPPNMALTLEDVKGFRDFHAKLVEVLEAYEPEESEGYVLVCGGDHEAVKVDLYSLQHGDTCNLSFATTLEDIQFAKKDTIEKLAELINESLIGDTPNGASLRAVDIKTVLLAQASFDLGKVDALEQKLLSGKLQPQTQEEYERAAMDVVIKALMGGAAALTSEQAAALIQDDNEGSDKD